MAIMTTMTEQIRRSQILCRALSANENPDAFLDMEKSGQEKICACAIDRDRASLGRIGGMAACGAFTPRWHNCGHAVPVRVSE